MTFQYSSFSRYTSYFHCLFCYCLFYGWCSTSKLTQAFLIKEVRKSSPFGLSSLPPSSSADDSSKTSLILQKALYLEPDHSWTTVELVGWTTLETSLTQRPGAVLTPSCNNKDTPSPALVLPLDNDISKKLLQVTYFSSLYPPTTVPVSLLLRLNAYIVNRDGGMFDTLPYTLWTKDTDNRWKDAAGNPVSSNYHGAKREAYQWLLGKDWNYFMTSNLKAATSTTTTTMTDPPTNKKIDNDYDDEDNAWQDMLKKRIQQLQIQELEQQGADLDQQCAMAKTRGDLEQFEFLQKERNQIQKQIDSIRCNPPETWMTSISTKTSTNPTSNTTTEISQYRNPYEMFRDLLQNRMKAKVIGTVLENTSFIDGNVVLGGALVLQRIVATQQVTLLGETVAVQNETEDYGNPDQVGGTVLVIECHADEAIGLSLACGLPCQIDTKLWRKASIMVSPTSTLNSTITKNELRQWKMQDTELTVLVEGEALQTARSERALPIRLPRTTLSLFDSILQGSSSTDNSTMFPTDNPIQSLEQYDALNVQDKARILLGLSNFDSTLPRPRTVRANPTVLDDLLLPLIDESVRRQYLIRDAERRGDTTLMETLLAQKSRRQIAMERAQNSNDSDATYWTEEAEFLSSLRADPTQDEGSYSRFLDRDEWYERQRQEQAKRVKRSQFGSLLDGIE